MSFQPLLDLLTGRLMQCLLVATAKDSCARSPTVRAIAVGEEQAWVAALVAKGGPCEEFKPVKADRPKVSLVDLMREEFGPEHGVELLSRIGAEFSLTSAQMEELLES